MPKKMIKQLGSKFVSGSKRASGYLKTQNARIMSALAPKRVQVRLEDIQATIDIDESMRWTFSENKYYEENVVHWYKQLVKLVPSHQAIYDIGANYGYYTLCGLYFQKQVIAFEPSSVVRKKLQKNIRQNKFSTKVFPFAVSDRSGKATFNIYSSSGNNSLVSRNIPENHELKFVKQETVTLTTLDSIIEIKHLPVPSLIKIDVEGAELFALKGAEKTIKLHNPTIIVEYSAATSTDAGYDKKEIYTFLKKNGYKPFGLSSDNVSIKLVPLRDGNEKNIDNIVAFSKEHLKELKIKAAS